MLTRPGSGLAPPSSVEYEARACSNSGNALPALVVSERFRYYAIRSGKHRGGSRYFDSCNLDLKSDWRLGRGAFPRAFESSGKQGWHSGRAVVPGRRSKGWRRNLWVSPRAGVVLRSCDPGGRSATFARDRIRRFRSWRFCTDAFLEQ